MSMLHRKLVRDLYQLWAQVLAIVAVTACGIGTYVMSASTVFSLEETRSEYYLKYAFANVFCGLKRAPESIADQIRLLPGVRLCETRVVTAGRLQLANSAPPSQVEILSIPEEGEPQLNRIHLRQGRLPSNEFADEVVVSESFARAHGLRLGDLLDAVIYGKKRSLQIVGIGLSPEFIYEIAPGGLLPDSQSFGVLWMSRRRLAAWSGMVGAFNNLSLTIDDRSFRPQLLKQIDAILDRYGGLGAIDRKDQRSHRFISSEMDELRSMGTVAPMIFMSVAAFLMNMVLSRLIATQREQIASLKAFGFSRKDVVKHYLTMAWSIAIPGTLVGTILGYLLGQSLTELYSKFFHFPTFHFFVPGRVIVIAWIISLSSALIGVWTSIRKVMKLQPAEAMRPEVPEAFHKGWTQSLENRLALGAMSRMVLRHLFRRPRRAILSASGIALSVAVLILGSFMQDAVYAMFDSMFELSKRYDLQVVFREPIDERVRFELHSIPGIRDCELFRAVPVRALTFLVEESEGYRENTPDSDQESDRREKSWTSHGSDGPPTQRLVSLVGLDPNPRLSLLVDSRGEVMKVPPQGLMVSRKLASTLGASIGDLLQLEVLEESRRSVQARIDALIEDIAGENIYVDRRVLSRLLQETPRANGAYVAADPMLRGSVMESLQSRPGVAIVTVTKDLKASFLATIGENVERMRRINIVFALVIAMGVIYSTARISLSERSRDLATLRVLGFSRREVRKVLWGELILLTFFAIPWGCFLGYGLASLTVRAMDRELFRMPLVIHGSTYIEAAVIVWLAMLAALGLLQWNLRNLSMIDVLKSRE